jgi:hypothetical protein
MSQIQNHWDEAAHIEAELLRYMMVLGLDWHDEAAMMQLAAECKRFSPEQAQAAYAAHDQTLISKAKLFALASTMMRTMEIGAHDNRDVHGGAAWKAFGKYLYS